MPTRRAGRASAQCEGSRLGSGAWSLSSETPFLVFVIAAIELALADQGAAMSVLAAPAPADRLTRVLAAHLELAGHRTDQARIHAIGQVAAVVQADRLERVA